MKAYVWITLLLACACGPPAAAAQNSAAPPAMSRPYVLAELNRHGVPPLLRGAETHAQWAAKRAEILSVWRDCIGELPPRVPVKFTVVSESKERDHVRQKIVFNTVHDDTVPAFLLIPDGARVPGRKSPAVLALHPTGDSGKTSVATPGGEKDRMYGYELVSRGYVVLAPDAMTSGDRVFPGHKAFRDAPFYERHPNWSTVAKNIVDHMQAVDLLASLPFVNDAAIGAIGHSFGGYNVYFLAGMDQRIAAGVSSCGVSPFTYNPQPGHWGVRNWYTHLPKITPELKQGRVPFEFNEIIALAAPAPMFFHTAQSDHIFPHWKGVGECLVDVRRLYTLLGAEERFVSVMTTGGHDFPEPVRKMAYDFLDRWLQNQRHVQKQVLQLPPPRPARK